jgi:methylphosphotriester-DNA--protein-cysteine methyltransferase
MPTVTTLRLGWPRKVAAGLMVLIGGAFVIVTLLANLFHVGPAFDRLTDGFRPIMTHQAISAAQQQVNGLSAAGTEIQTKMLPALAQQLHMTPTQVQQMMAQQYPDVAKGLAQVQPISKSFTGLLNNLDQTQPLFVSADAIPTKDIPATSVPWALLAVGVVSLGLGVLVWFSPRLGTPIVVTLMGAALIALPLSMNMVHKASNADQMNANLKPVYNQALIDNASGALQTLGAMGTQLQQEMLPQLAAQLHMTPTQLQHMLQTSFPNTAGALATLPKAMANFRNMVGQFDKHLSDYNTLKPVSFEPIVWFMIGGGIALFLLGGAGVVICRFGRRSTQ